MSMLQAEHFDGDTFDAQEDGSRLTRQLYKIRHIMARGQWHTLAQLESLTGYPQASISARLRDLRKERHGAWDIQRRRVPGMPGVHEYRALMPDSDGQMGMGF